MRSTLFSALRQSRGFSLLEVMVALAILGVSLVAIFQLFSITLRSTRKADSYTRALFYARSMMDEFYAAADPEKPSQSEDFEDGFSGSRKVTKISTPDKTGATAANMELYQIEVTIKWEPSGRLDIKGLRSVNVPE